MARYLLIQYFSRILMEMTMAMAMAHVWLPSVRNTKLLHIFTEKYNHGLLTFSSNPIVFENFLSCFLVLFTMVQPDSYCNVMRTALRTENNLFVLQYYQAYQHNIE